MTPSGAWSTSSGVGAWTLATIPDPAISSSTGPDHDGSLVAVGGVGEVGGGARSGLHGHFDPGPDQAAGHVGDHGHAPFTGTGLCGNGEFHEALSEHVGRVVSTPLTDQPGGRTTESTAARNAGHSPPPWASTAAPDT